MGDLRSPDFLQSHLRYSHIADVFANHVGDGALDVPLIDVSFTISFALSTQCLAHFLKHHTTQYFSHGTSTQICDKAKLCRPPNGTPRASSPTSYSGKLFRRKIATLFADFTLFNGIEKSGAEIFSPTPLFYYLYFCVLLVLFCTA